jgi:hypothetical protein
VSAQFEYSAQLETAWQRRVRLVVEVVDAVSGELIRDGIKVIVKEFRAAPIVNASGRFVWLVEPGIVPTEVTVDPQRLPYLPATVAVGAPPPPPPPVVPQYNVVRIELAPTSAYPFDAGTTGLRGTLIRNDAEFPPVPLQSDEVWLQWMDDALPPPGWTSALVRGKTDAAGDFAAIVRLASNQTARTDSQGRMHVRIAATHAGVTQFSPQLQIRPGYVADVQQSFAWNQFTP